MRGKRKKKLVAMMVAMMVAMKKLVAIGKTGKKNHEKENATMTKMPDTYQCEICSTEGDVADLRGFYGSGGQISFNTVGNCRRHIHQKCLDALVEARAKETKTEKAVSLGRNSFAARSLAEQTLAAAKAEVERLTKELADLRDSMSMGLLLWPEAKNYLDITEASFSVRADDLREMVAAKAEAGQLRKELDIHHAKFTNCYSVWSNGQLVKCLGTARDMYEDAKKTTFPVMLGANDFRLMVEAMEITKAIETLREGGGHLVVYQIDELDPRTSIGVCGDWTHEEWQTFRGDTLHAALAWAVEARLEKR